MLLILDTLLFKLEFLTNGGDIVNVPVRNVSIFVKKINICTMTAIMKQLQFSMKCRLIIYFGFHMLLQLYTVRHLFWSIY